MKKTEKVTPTPPMQAIPAKVTRAGRGGIIPPIEHRFKPGQSGNPSGRPSAGLSIKEQINRMTKWTEADVRRVFEAKDSTVDERTAAKAWLDAFTTDRTAAGHPLSGEALDRIADRTYGRPRQQVDVTALPGGATIDVSLLTVEELDTFKMLLAKTCGLPAPAALIEGVVS